MLDSKISTVNNTVHVNLMKFGRIMSKCILCLLFPRYHAYTLMILDLVLLGLAVQNCGGIGAYVLLSYGEFYVFCHSKLSSAANLCAVGRSPAESSDGMGLGHMSETKLSAELSTASKHHVDERQPQNSSVARLPTTADTDVDSGLLRKHSRKSRLCVKNEHGPEWTGKTTHHRHYHRPPTPDSSPIRLLPFSPSQVASTTFSMYL